MDRRWRPSKPWDAQPITNGLAAGVPEHTLSPPVADRGQGRVGGGRRGAHRHGGAGLDRPGRLGPPRRRTLPDLSYLAGRRRRQATHYAVWKGQQRKRGRRMVEYRRRLVDYYESTAVTEVSGGA
jgi:hypothetical protein